MKPVAILCSDLHLQERAPVARSAEPDWWAAMLRPVEQLKALAKKHKVPVVCAGDVFDHWKAPPALINWALEHLPVMYAVPGQHDLPLHNYDDVDKSAYGTLVRFGKIIPLHYQEPRKVHHGFVLHGFPWNHPIEPLPKVEKDTLHLAVVHAYCWTKDASYPGAKDEQRLGAHKKNLGGYHAAVFGDNHKPFLSASGICAVFNHGSFMRRKIDEVEHKPAFGILMSDGSIELHAQDCSQDLFIERETAKFQEGDEFEMAAFLKELSSLGGTELDFRDAVKRYLATYEVSEGARQIILKTLHE